MSQEKIEPAKRQRQKHNQNDVREFKCPCGKAYLSYPALYTHVRTKHDGKVVVEISSLLGIYPNQKMKKPEEDLEQLLFNKTPIEDSQSPFDIAEQISKLLSENNTVDIQYDFVKSEGRTTCQDMTTQLLQELANLDSSRLNTVKCYLNQLKEFLGKKYGNEYWSQSSPQDMIDSANQFEQNHELNKDKSPLTKTVLIELTYLLFKWMHRKGWTSHVLAKRTANSKTDE